MSRFDPVGHEVIDEEIACREQVTITAGTYYRGYAAELAGEQMLDAASADYGVWSAVSKGGTRQTVVAYPGALPGGATEVAWDPRNGEVLSTTARSVYARYVAHGAFVRREVVAVIAGTLTDAVTADYWSRTAPVELTVRHYEITARTAPGANVTLELRDAMAGGGTATNLSLSSGATASGVVALATPRSFGAGDLMVLRGDGQGAADVAVVLYC